MSNDLRALQIAQLCGEAPPRPPHAAPDGADAVYLSRWGFPVRWYRSLDLVAATAVTGTHAIGRSTTRARATAGHADARRVGPPIYVLAHEFFDALPVHQFQMTADGWREHFVDVDAAADGAQPTLRLVLSRQPTLASRLLLPHYLQATQAHGLQHAPVGTVVEVAADAWNTMAQIAKMIIRRGGAALVIDYGRNGPAPGGTVRAMRAHAPHPLLEAPGSADVTADVDFSYLRHAATTSGGTPAPAAADSAVPCSASRSTAARHRRAPDAPAHGARASASTHGPVAQRCFLDGLGGRARVRRLMQDPRLSAADRAALGASYERLVGEMGERFLALAITRPDQPPVDGFYRAPPTVSAATESGRERRGG